MISTSMTAPERIYHRMAGGGGFGDPLLRDPSLVARDVRNDKVSLRAAQDLYGVVLLEGTLAVNDSATSTLRSQMKLRKD